MNPRGEDISASHPILPALLGDNDHARSGPAFTINPGNSWSERDPAPVQFPGASNFFAVSRTFAVLCGLNMQGAPPQTGTKLLRALTINDL